MSLTSSIVLATWNGVRYLPAQWASLLAQTRLPDEIVARDDASTDATPGLLDELAARARARGIAVRCIRGERNLGAVANFAATLPMATGDVVCLCDQDDVWHADKLATQMAAFERRPALRLLCSDARRIDATGALLRHPLLHMLHVARAELHAVHAGRGFDVLMRRNVATGATVALRRSLLEDALPIPAGWVHDEWLAIIAAVLGGFDGVDAALIDYRQHAGNQIGARDRGLRELWHEVRHPRGDLLEWQVARTEGLLQRLRQLQGRVPQRCVDRAADKLAHLRVRQAMGGAPWSRTGPILRESLNGRYHRYSIGWRAALRDWLRQS